MHRLVSSLAIIAAVCLPAWAAQPQLISLDPASGSGQSQTFTLTASDASGAADIGSMNLLINSSLEGSTGCWIYFDHPHAQFTLYSSGNWMGPASTGGTLSSSVCSVKLASSSDSGNNATVSFAITFNAAFAGSRTIWAAAGDQAGNNSGYQPMGSFTVTSTGQGPAVISVSPDSSTMNQNATQTFTFVASDSAGVTDLQGVDILFSDGSSNPYACWMWYQRATNTVSLYNQGTWSSPAKVGTGGTVLAGNSCSVNTSQGTATFTANQLTLTLPFTPTSGDNTAWPIYMNAITNANSGTGYQQMGTVTVHPVATGSFTLKISPWPSRTGVAQGASASYTVTVVPSGGFNSAVSFSGHATVGPNGDPANLSFSFNPSTVTASGSTTMTVSTAGAPAGAYTITATGASDSTSATTPQVGLDVESGPPTVSLSAPFRIESQIYFVMDVMDPAGHGAISNLNLLIASSLNGQNACWMAWVPGTTTPNGILTLATDDASQWLFAGYTQTPNGGYGNSPAVSNSQCTVEGDQASVQYFAPPNNRSMPPTEGQWKIPVTFNSNFTGAKTIYVYVANDAGFSTGYQALGTVTTP
jgi:hypothetical protein